jgi:AcrR family transcriptional regulator
MLTEQALIMPRVKGRVKMDRRMLILDAAERVLSAKGLAGTTTRAVTTEAKCAEGTLYLYFAGRAELLLAVFERRLHGAFPEGIPPLTTTGDAPVDALVATALRFLAFQRDVVPILAGIFAEPALLAQYRALVKARFSTAPRAAPAIVAFIDAERRAGRIPKHVHAQTTAEALLGACFARAFHDHLFADRQTAAADRRFMHTLVTALLD